jgi:hypothetical protein
MHPATGAQVTTEVPVLAGQTFPFSGEEQGVGRQSITPSSSHDDGCPDEFALSN